jgi:hypothetical protein
MTRLQHFVVLHQGESKVKFDGKHYGPYRTQADAIRDAVDAAHKAGKQGHDSQVLAQGMNHQFRTEWAYGHDPYPPAG